jgi:putative membrane protein
MTYFYVINPLLSEEIMKKILFPLIASLSVATVAFAAGGPSDAEIAAIVVAANQVDVDAGEFAKTHASTAEVKAFADKMVQDHTSVNNQAKALVQKLHVTPVSSASSEGLTEGGEKNIKALGELSGSAFDKAYVDHEVAYHEAVIDVVSKTLIPSASNQELKNLLVKSAPIFVEHLHHAQELQKKLAAN